jgi:hypothetical protein
MVRQDILEGLRQSLLRGESLGKAMHTFFNAGYKKEDIEEAARTLQLQPQSTTPKNKPQEPFKKIEKLGKKEKPIQKVSDYNNSSKKIKKEINSKTDELKDKKLMIGQKQKFPEQVDKKNTQKISEYSNTPKNNKIYLIILLIIFLIFLFGFLTSVFFFKDEVTQFINNLF